jgi:hypothetical protein
MSESAVVDADGRRIALRRLNALDKLRLFEAAGPELSRNDRWLGMAALAASVTAIDDVPIPVPNSKAAIEGVIRRLGDAGIAAVAGAVAAEPDAATTRAVAGN